MAKKYTSSGLYELSSYIRPIAGRPDTLELVDPATGGRIDVRADWPYAAMRNDERLRRGRDFWEHCGGLANLLVLYGRHREAGDLGGPGGFEKLLASVALYGFEGPGAPDDIHACIAALPKRKRPPMDGHTQRLTDALAASAALPFCYDVPAPRPNTPGFDLDAELTALLELGEISPSRPTPPGMTPEQRAQWVVVSEVAHNYYLFDNLGYRMDALTRLTGERSAPVMITIGAGHQPFLDHQFAEYGVDATAAVLAPSPPEAEIFKEAALTGEVTTAAIGTIAAHYTVAPSRR